MAFQRKTVAALILAAGRGTRMGPGAPKQYRRLAGEAVLTHTLRRFASQNAVDRIVCVAHPDDGEDVRAALESAGVEAPIVAGGATRAHSVLNGLRAIAEAPPDIVLIQDGARPLTHTDDISEVLKALENADGAVLGVPMSDTVKRVADGAVAETVPRQDLMRAQTPQAFAFLAILETYEKTSDRLDAITDDASAAEAAGLSVVMVPARHPNIKLTTPEDFAIAEALLGERKAAAMRIGHGFDVHAFTEGDKVNLCGVDIPHTHALAGHSDADVAMHAVTDALMGAVGAGDIGEHFPPSEAKWKGAASAIFLKKAGDLVAEAGYEISNIDLTIICEAPKIGPHKAAMRARLAEVLGIDAGRVNVKATTTEKLGFTGRKEGIAAEAVCCVQMG